jgi:hypothetical protein
MGRCAGMIKFGLAVCQRWTPAQVLTRCQTAADDRHPVQFSAICQAQSVIKSVLWFVSNGKSVAKIWPLQALSVFGGFEIKFALCLYVCKLRPNIGQTQTKPVV